MTESLRALLTGVIDYAGLFPPAALPLEQALRHYARYRTEAESWMLGNFICPVDKLVALTSFVDEWFREGAPLPVIVLLQGSGRYRVLDEQLRSLDKAQHGQLKMVGAEIRLSGELETPRSETEEATLAVVAGPIYWEPPRGADPRAVAQRIAETNQLVRGPSRPLPAMGYKLRCGGVEAAAFPAVDEVAAVLAACRDAGVPLKFTAGLHHPIRRFDPGLRVKMHGFLNVFVAGVLAQVRQLSEEQLGRILEDEDAGGFRFDDRALHWRDLSATVAEITAARRFVTSFGSCSFDEPRDDLRQLGWL